MAMKKAVFFTIDALLASGIIIIAILLVGNFYSAEQQKANVNFASQDLVRVFSTTNVGQVDNSLVKTWISDGTISNINNTIFEQIGDFWANSQTNLSYNFTKNLTEGIIPAGLGYSVLVNGEEIYSRNLPIKRILLSSRKLVTGIAKAKPTQGFTARVLLNGIISKKTNAYAYFGGYEGDGNLTKKLILPSSVIKFNNSYIEVDDGGDFDLYINGIFSGTFTKGSGGGGGNGRADKWNVSNIYLSNFRAGDNTINLYFKSGNNYIAGGFLRVTYITSSFNDTQTQGYQKYFLPGIDGIINLYSSIYVPGSLSYMSAYLNYSSVYNTYLRIGNVTVYQENPNGTVKAITLDNTTLGSVLDYNFLSQKTVPLRFGVTNGTTLGGIADVVLVSDVSGSMDWCSRTPTETWSGWNIDAAKGCRLAGINWNWYWYNFTPQELGYSNYNRTIWNNGTNNLCGCRFHTQCINDTRKLDIYVNSSLLFLDTILNVSGNKVGLVEFSSNLTAYNNSCIASSPNTTVFPNSLVRNNSITSNKQQLVNMISTSEAWLDTCTCCGINKAVNMTLNQSFTSRKRFIVLMSDGDPNVQCPEQPNSTAVADAVQSAWDACNKNISVYTIGFGNDANATTLQRMNCSGGKFYNATNATLLQQVFTQIAGEINSNVTFNQQTVNATGAVRSVLYPGSYIEFNYTSPDVGFNKVPIGFETGRFENNISTGTLTIYANTSVYEAKVTSYSGSRWTDKLVVNGVNAYRLSDFGDNYQILGDPFIVNIPAGYLNIGSNTITISTGLNSSYSTNGSSDDKIIYTLLLNGAADYTSVVSKSSGCAWTVAFEDGTATTINVPSNYNEGVACNYAGKSYDANDALNIAAYQLFGNLDFDKNGKLDVNIDANNLNVNTLTVSKVPSLWGPAIIEIRVWQ